MRKIFAVILLTTLSCQLTNAKSANEADRIKVLEEKCSVLQSKQTKADKVLRNLTDKQNEYGAKVRNLSTENSQLKSAVDSLQGKLQTLEASQSADRKDINGKIDETNSNVQTSRDMLQSRTFWVVGIALILLIIIITITYILRKRIQFGASSIDDVRKAQEALQTAQARMQEESVKLDNQLLTIAQKQLEAASATSNKASEPDHSLALKVADEITRIELNLSRMDSTVKGYKQLAKAVERIKDNFKANGYEIVDMLGKPYNEGMKVIANFVPDEDLEEGTQIITGITKPQVNYNGQMIQAAQITVSQNI